MPPFMLDKSCSRCGAKSWERLPRNSFFQIHVLSFLGLYPWRCAVCNRVRWLPLRADPRVR